jgi:hypothetical protein
MLLARQDDELTAQGRVVSITITRRIDYQGDDEHGWRARETYAEKFPTNNAIMLARAIKASLTSGKSLNLITRNWLMAGRIATRRTRFTKALIDDSRPALTRI